MESFYKKGLVFSPEDNVWDYYPFRWAPAVESGAPDDTGSDDDEYVGEQWHAQPNSLATPPSQRQPLILRILVPSLRVSFSPTYHPCSGDPTLG